jgi:hypothetical protein
MDEYKVLAFDNLNELIESVNKNLSAGWKLAGGVAASVYFDQAGSSGDYSYVCFTSYLQALSRSS